jgi:hypothetical protein
MRAIADMNKLIDSWAGARHRPARLTDAGILQAASGYLAPKALEGSLTCPRGETSYRARARRHDRRSAFFRRCRRSPSARWRRAAMTPNAQRRPGHRHRKPWSKMPGYQLGLIDDYYYEILDCSPGAVDSEPGRGGQLPDARRAFALVGRRPAGQGQERALRRRPGRRPLRFSASRMRARPSKPTSPRHAARRSAPATAASRRSSSASKAKCRSIESRNGRFRKRPSSPLPPTRRRGRGRMSKSHSPASSTKESALCRKRRSPPLVRRPKSSKRALAPPRRLRRLSRLLPRLQVKALTRVVTALFTATAADRVRRIGARVRRRLVTRAKRADRKATRRRNQRRSRRHRDAQGLGRSAARGTTGVSGAGVTAPNHRRRTRQVSRRANSIIQRAGPDRPVRQGRQARRECRRYRRDLDPGEFRGVRNAELARCSWNVPAFASAAMTARNRRPGADPIDPTRARSATRPATSPSCSRTRCTRRLQAAYAVRRTHGAFLRHRQRGRLPRRTRVTCAAPSARSTPHRRRGVQEQEHPRRREGIDHGKTKGNIIALTRDAIVNDDLGAFGFLGVDLGRAAALSIEVDVYATLAQNSGAGPTMNDGNRCSMRRTTTFRRRRRRRRWRRSTMRVMMAKRRRTFRATNISTSPVGLAGADRPAR